MHQHACVGKAFGDARDLFDAHAFFHELQQAVAGHLQPTRHGDTTALSQQIG